MKKKILTILKEYLIITFGIFLVAVGAYFFKFPNNISTGGVTGLAVVLNQAFPVLTASNYVTIFNTAFLIMGFVVLGKDFGIKTFFHTSCCKRMTQRVKRVILYTVFAQKLLIPHI